MYRRPRWVLRTVTSVRFDMVHLRLESVGWPRIGSDVKDRSPGWQWTSVVGSPVRPLWRRLLLKPPGPHQRSQPTMLRRNGLTHGRPAVEAGVQHRHHALER